MTLLPLSRAARRARAASDARDGAEADERVEATLRREAPDLLAYFTRRVRPAEDAADLLSETMLVAWRRNETLPVDREQARRWLFGVARRVLATHVRGARRRSALADELRDSLAADAARSGTGEESEDPRLDLMRELVAALPERDRDILALVVWEGFALVDLAEVLGLPQGTVRSRYSRARATVRAGVEAALG